MQCKVKANHITTTVFQEYELKNSGLNFAKNILMLNSRKLNSTLRKLTNLSHYKITMYLRFQNGLSRQT